MKYKATIKEIKQGYRTIIAVGYSGLQGLLKDKYPIAYNCGVYGWNFDLYDIGGVAIVTGYRNMPTKNAHASYELTKEYEEKAEGKTAEEKDKLLREFIEKATFNKQ